MREIVLDTETTGLDPTTGDRIVEIGCVELFNTLPTGQTFHVYLDPERDVPEEAFRVHGLSYDFLKGKPKFKDVARDFLEFINNSNLIIHNADFDVKFLNAELASCGHSLIEKNRVIDTLAIARRKHPGSSNSLDALCSRYKIDNSRRTRHGALLDAEILADVYVELSGGRQTILTLQTEAPRAKHKIVQLHVAPAARDTPISPLLTNSEKLRHSEAVKSLGQKAFWSRHLS